MRKRSHTDSRRGLKPASAGAARQAGRRARVDRPEGCQEKIRVERHRLDAEGHAAPAAAQVQHASATPVSPVLRQKGMGRQHVEVSDDGVGHVSHSASRRHPAVAEISIFSAGETEAPSEPAKAHQPLARACEIVAGEEALSAGPCLEVLVQEINEILAGRRIWVGGAPVPCVAAEQCAGEASVSLRKLPQPVSFRPAIIVREGNEIAAGTEKSAVSGAGRTCLLLSNDGHSLVL